jgi:hypothetical protein
LRHLVDGLIERGLVEFEGEAGGVEEALAAGRVFDLVGDCGGAGAKFFVGRGQSGFQSFQCRFSG